ncbi:MAG: LysR family transcriptional regulator [Longibaculum muris]|uniref:DNA-binding transcriptional LysR family regulator n=1 Tax=Longibaculum muris TaxID=1796628 RepID=A0A4R3YLE0_9FIRM|nr:LysR family transcriptional regulator [Longibaculum muris]KXU51952.1 transcriptional regulator, LysR family [Candidatus Stoquefichus sp. KLE1796]MBS5369156.1 LysR family transcriptional regulator [Coprobacillus cateniformis]MCR1889108.1 LysR family transcriptional regulator [Longibaculum muris]MED9811534.1 LysR family transcriptional regulator [Longibaculum muris]TCV93086.1 DNA-binding transcriptional LysR family regulator [Longibaculum muris]
MEFRVLQYFLAVAREQSISRAAEFLHLSQPTLSRQLKDLEEELGKQLFIRGNRNITLTEEGMILRKRAEEITELVRKAEQEISCNNDIITGDIYIGAGETEVIKIIARVAQKIQQMHPQVHIHIVSGDTEYVTEQLDKGLIDFGLVFEPTELSKYNYKQLPYRDVWGVLMRKDSPLSSKQTVCPSDLWDKPLIISRQGRDGYVLPVWMQKNLSELNIVATYSLLYNGSILVNEGIGYALCLDKIINTTGNSNLCFKPLNPKLEIGMNIIWKKYQVLSKANELFLNFLTEIIQPITS